MRGSAYAFLMYDDIRNAGSPREAVLEFLQSAYDAGAKRARWDIEALSLKPLAHAGGQK
jgi:hypothetical protein